MKTNWTRVTGISLALCVLALAAVALTGAAPPSGTSASKASASKIERGRYLVMICGCNDCHTPGNLYGQPDFDRQLSGSELGWQGPWGVTYPRNLTPDMETGIGKWTSADIMKTFRSGVRPDGSTLLPPMPWQAYSAMNDEDASAVAAFLKSLKPVHHKAPDRVPPGQAAAPGTALVFPPPPAWDVPKGMAKDETMPASKK